MKVKRIEIRNFRGIRQFNYEIFSDINVIAGTNGAGKSSLLDAMKILFSWLIARIRNAKGKGIDIEDEDITKGEKYCFLRIVLDNDVEWQIYKPHSKYRGKPLEKTDLSGIKNVTDELAENIGEFAENLHPIAFPMIASYGTNRLVEKTPEKVRKTGEQSPLDALDVSMKNSINFHKFFVWFRELEDEENASARFGELKVNHQLQTVRSAIDRFYPEYTNFKVKRSKPVGFSIVKNGVEFSFDSLSDGEKTYLILIMDIARRLAMTNPSMDNPLEAEGVVLIDEVDLHLHPSWQRELIDKLLILFPNCQFFLTTHSPHVVSSVNRSEGHKLLTVRNGEINEVSSSLYGLESDAVLAEIFQMPSLRTPKVQEHYDIVWQCLNKEAYESEKFNESYKFLKDNVDNADAMFARINLQIALIKKKQSYETHSERYASE